MGCASCVQGDEWAVLAVCRGMSASCVQGMSGLC